MNALPSPSCSCVQPEGLRTVFTQGCTVLHFSGHADAQLLFLETESGRSQLVNTESLRSLLCSTSPVRAPLVRL